MHLPHKLAAKFSGEVEDAVNWFGPGEIRRGRRGHTLHLGGLI